MRGVLLVCVLWGCVEPGASEPGAVPADAALIVDMAVIEDAAVEDAAVEDAAVEDAAVEDAAPDMPVEPDMRVEPDMPAEPVTWGEVEPILRAHCGQCHIAGESGAPAFLGDYEEMLAEAQNCPGLTVGGCIVRAVQHQEVEGERCRTYIVDPFHRDGWLCLDADQRGRIEAWGAGGFLR